uniref:Uncharacterized protein n=1 Tax=Arundo donax TaxID=35708 RepID=A0A0A8Z4F6_ARUDO
MAEETNAGLFSGLASLRSLRAFHLDNRTYEEDFVEDVQNQLRENKNGPVLKRYNVL